MLYNDVVSVFWFHVVKLLICKAPFKLFEFEQAKITLRVLYNMHAGNSVRTY